MFYSLNFPNIVLNHFAHMTENSLCSDEYFNWSDHGYRWEYGISWDLWILAIRKKGARHVAEVLQSMEKKSIQGAISQLYTRALDELEQKHGYGAFLRFYVKVGDMGFSPFPTHQILKAADFKGVERCVHKDHIEEFRNIIKAKLGLTDD